MDDLTDLLLDAKMLVLRRALLRAFARLERAPASAARQPSLRRPQGWAAELVVEALGRADRPLGPAEIAEDIRIRLGEEVLDANIRHVLRRGREARAGKIVQLAPGAYVLRDKEAQ